MSGEAPRTLSAVILQIQGPALACEGSSCVCGSPLLVTGPHMDALLTGVVCTVHSVVFPLSNFVAKQTDLNVIMIGQKGSSLCKQCTYPDKGRGLWSYLVSLCWTRPLS